MAQAGLVFVRVSHHCVDENCRSMKSKMPSEVCQIVVRLPYTDHFTRLRHYGYLKRHTSIPASGALVYDPDSDNRVGRAWMIMEAVGVSVL